MLKRNEIYFASARSFNDPFDCRIQLRYDKLTRKQLFDRVQRLIKFEHPYLDKNEILGRANDRLDQENLRKPETLQKFWREQNDFRDTKYGIFSLTSDPKNIPMWSHYAKNHTGICVGFSSTKLLSFFKEVEKRTGVIFEILEVEYRNSYPTLIPTLNDETEIILSSLATKSKKWENESEWRLISYTATGNYQVTNLPVQLDNEIICEIILGCRMDETRYEPDITKLFEDKHPNASLLKAEPKQFKFGLDILPVS